MVINFTDALQQRQEQEEIKEMKEFFMAYIKPNLTPADVEVLKNAVVTGDLEAYKAITQPIIMKQLIREYNRGESRDEII